MNSHTVVLGVALVALLCLTGVGLTRLRSLDGDVRRAWIRRAEADSALLRVLDRGLGGFPLQSASCGCGVLGPATALPAIEQVAAELRRLDRARTRGGWARQSRLWSAAIERAYDRWLQVACHYLEVSHHLFCLSDVDRAIERVRIEAELTAAGLPIRGRPSR